MILRIYLFSLIYYYVVSFAAKKKKIQNISSFASSTLAKAAFLCNVLLENIECHHLAFKVGMFGLEMPRPPAFSKALEVSINGFRIVIRLVSLNSA